MHVIGDEVTKVVLDFFDTSKIYKPINTVAVTLIPKVKNSSSIRAYIPIFCCTTLYKILFKMIISRLQHVMKLVVECNQAAFVHGRMLTNNVILSHKLVRRYGRKGISLRCMTKIDIQKHMTFWSDNP